MSTPHQLALTLDAAPTYTPRGAAVAVSRHPRGAAGHRDMYLAYCSAFALSGSAQQRQAHRRKAHAHYLAWRERAHSAQAQQNSARHTQSSTLPSPAGGGVL